MMRISGRRDSIVGIVTTPQAGRPRVRNPTGEVVPQPKRPDRL
jgi:hypothetical protein